MTFIGSCPPFLFHSNKDRNLQVTVPGVIVIVMALIFSLPKYFYGNNIMNLKGRLELIISPVLVLVETLCIELLQRVQMLYQSENQLKPK
jgi:hypothetical protein